MVKKRTMQTCERCGVLSWVLHRHHKTPKSLGGTWESENIERICPTCHTNAHFGPDGDKRPWRKNPSDAERQRRAEAAKKRWEDPNFREKHRAATQASWARGDHDEHTEANRARFSDPVLDAERRAKISATKRALDQQPTPEAVRRSHETQSLKGRWSRGHTACVACGLTTNPHAGSGYCRPCYHKARAAGTLTSVRTHSEATRIKMSASRTLDRWSRDHEGCVQCSTTEIPHAAHGLCDKCNEGQRERKFGPKPWPAQYPFCTECKRRDITYGSGGLCVTCVGRRKRANR